jgi:hypothetical protein
MTHEHGKYGEPPPEALVAQQHESPGEIQKRLLYEEIDLQLGWAVGQLPSEFNSVTEPDTDIKADIQSIRRQLRSNSGIPIDHLIQKMNNLQEHLKQSDEAGANLQTQNAVTDFIKQLEILSASQKEHEGLLPAPTGGA